MECNFCYRLCNSYMQCSNMLQLYLLFLFGRRILLMPQKDRPQKGKFVLMLIRLLYWMHGIELIVKQERLFGVAFFQNLFRAMRYIWLIRRNNLWVFLPRVFKEKINVVSTLDNNLQIIIINYQIIKDYFAWFFLKKVFSAAYPNLVDLLIKFLLQFSFLSIIPHKLHLFSINGPLSCFPSLSELFYS